MDGIAWAAGAMAAAKTRLDVAAANLANGSTDGYRKSDLRGFLNASGISLQRLRDDAQGPLRSTGRPFDLAIAGHGSFRVRTPSGLLQETRGGAFRRDGLARLVDGNGRVLMGSAGPVRVPDGAKIAQDGAVTLDGKFLNRIPLPRGSTVHSGFLEGSNVDAIGEMIDVLSAERSFETAQKVLTSIDQTRERAASAVGALK
ncbi:MAG TPA: flagellar basal body rod C-terminal domain-containing protein [Candidatus Baltobacteraceae bacterium]|jgi:flagellar basal body rod protein FlgG|nr:flagellar basal body rod C-terminal domain-containing protein [Candidatus Baltobacteraceae bacterium]